jgi:hypothetical protein
VRAAGTAQRPCWSTLRSVFLAAVKVVCAVLAALRAVRVAVRLRNASRAAALYWRVLGAGSKPGADAE